MKVEIIPPEAPQALRDLADMVNQATRAEAEANRRAGFTHDEALRRAMICTGPSRVELQRRFAYWASLQAPRMIVRPE